LAKLQFKLGKNSDDQDLINQVGVLNTKINLMKKTLLDAKAAEKEANPAAAEAERIAQERAAEAKEKAERLDDDIRLELINKMKRVFATGDEVNIKALLTQQKEVVDAAKQHKKDVANGTD
jgi:predicted  nucleic acid-binding Zn-ribbon protein